MACPSHLVLISGVHMWRSLLCKGDATMSHTTTLRTLIQAPDLLVMPGIFDGFSARLVAQTGFAAGFISGAGLSETLLGYSDVGLMGFELNLAAVTRLAACCPLPVLADADTGYGNAVNVYYTIRAFEQAGVAGLMIEDQTWPKRCGHMQGKEVIPAEEMVEKVHAAWATRVAIPAFVLMARTDAFATHGMPEVLRRLTLYAEAGPTSSSPTRWCRKPISRPWRGTSPSRSVSTWASASAPGRRRP